MNRELDSHINRLTAQNIVLYPPPRLNQTYQKLLAENEELQVEHKSIKSQLELLQTGADTAGVRAVQTQGAEPAAGNHQH